MSVEKKGLALLREPFPKNQISLLPKPTTKDGKKATCAECGAYHAHPAIHLEYVGHAALTDRLLDADPNWTWEPLALKDGLPAFDSTGGLWIKLTVCGITRLGYGHAMLSQYKEIGSREKEVIGDALRNAAMRFGAALYLWHKGELHVEAAEESQDKPKEPPAPPPAPVVPPKQSSTALLTEPQRKRLFAIADKHGWQETRIKDYIQQRFGIGSTKDLTRFNYDFLISAIERTPAVK